MNFTISDLEFECRAAGISLSPEDLSKKPVRKNLIQKLQAHFLPYREDSWGLAMRLKLESPMLCWRWKDLKDFEKEKVLSSDDFFAEEKINGVRAIVTYHKDEGLRIFSRHLSVQDFLPVDYTDKILIDLNGDELHPKQVRFDDVTSFVLDVEIQSTKAQVLVGKELTNSQLNATVAILNAEPELARSVQKDQTVLIFHYFDLLEIDSSEMNLNIPWFLRTRGRKRLDESSLYFCDSFSLVSPSSDIIGLYKNVISSQRGEGVVIKHLASTYDPSESRSHRMWIKMKRSMTGSIISDLDVFILGSVPATKGKRNEDYIGGLKLGVLLEDDTVHHIATVSNLSDSFRKMLTTKESVGSKEPEIKPEFLHKVLSIDGMSVSPKNLRIMHAVLLSTNFRLDKSPNECRIEKRDLENLIM